MRQNGIKFGINQKVEFRKSFKLLRQILVRVLTKVALIFVHLHVTNESKQNAENIK
jgi:hypothetical protein